MGLVSGNIKYIFKYIPCLRSIEQINNFSICPICKSLIEKQDYSLNKFPIKKKYISIGEYEDNVKIIVFDDLKMVESIVEFVFYQQPIGEAFTINYDPINNKTSLVETNIDYKVKTNSFEILFKIMDEDFVDACLHNIDKIKLIKVYRNIIFPILLHEGDNVSLQDFGRPIYEKLKEIINKGVENGNTSEKNI